MTEEKRPKKAKPKKINIIPILALLLLIVLAYFFVKTFLKRDNAFSKAYSKRYEADSLMLNRLNHVNSNFIMDNNYQIGSKYFEKNYYQWNDKTEMTLDKNLSLALKQYFYQKKITPENLSISIVLQKDGEKFTLNDKVKRNYAGIDKLLLNMSLNKLIDSKKANFSDKVSVQKSDLTEESVFFDEATIGLTYEVKELMKLSLQNDDIPARNMLKRYLVEKSKTKYLDQLIKDFNINFADNLASTEETLNLAREFYRNKNLYQDVFLYNSKKNRSSFIKYIVKEYSTNFTVERDNRLYDVGFIDGPVDYTYSIYAQDLKENEVSELGDIIDRKINEYILLKK